MGVLAGLGLLPAAATAGQGNGAGAGPVSEAPGRRAADLLGFRLDGGLRDDGRVDGTDDAPALASALRTNPAVAIPLGVPTAMARGGDTLPRYALIDQPVEMPASASLEGVGAGGAGFIVRTAPGAALLSRAMFLLNVDPLTGKARVPLPNVPSGAVRNLRFSAYHAALAGHAVRAFLYAGSPKFEDCQFIGFATVARATADFNDMPVFRRIAALQSFDGGTDSWLIDHVEGQGDGGIVEQCMFLGADDPALGGATRRARAIRLRNRSGWAVRQIVNGDIHIIMCRGAELTGLYMERGITTVENSRGTALSNSVYFQRETGMQAVTPVVLTNGGVGEAHSGHMENIGFIYDPLGQQVPWTTPATPGNFDRQGRPNFTVTGKGRWAFRDLYREFSPGDYTRSTITGVSCGQHAFDDQAHIASQASAYNDGRWAIAGELGSLAGSAIAARGDDGYLPFTAGGGTYHYAAQFLFDRNRMVGLAAPLALSIAVRGGGRMGGGGAPVIAVTLHGPAMVRVYRGTAAGRYDRYVDVPATSSLLLYDLGETLNERRWLSRAAGPMDAIAAADAYTLAPGAGGTRDDPAYGNASCLLCSDAAPASGTWHVGDMAMLKRSVVEQHGGLAVRRTGFRRLTDGAVHVPGRDWAAIHELALPQSDEASAS